MNSPRDLESKIKNYEFFLQDTLKRDLNEVQGILKDKVSKYKDWEQVKNVIKTLEDFLDKDRDMKVCVELGCGVHVQGEVADYQNTYINIGLGCHLEMDRHEADKYADIRLKALKKDIDHFRQLAVNVKVNIKMVLLAISELQQTLL